MLLIRGCVLRQYGLQASDKEAQPCSQATSLDTGSEESRPASIPLRPQQPARRPACIRASRSRHQVVRLHSPYEGAGNVEIGRTEIISNTLNPKFVTIVPVVSQRCLFPSIVFCLSQNCVSCRLRYFAPLHAHLPGCNSTRTRARTPASCDLLCLALQPFIDTRFHQCRRTNAMCACELRFLST